MPFNLFPILWRLLLLRMNKLLNFHYFFRNFTCNSPIFSFLYGKDRDAGEDRKIFFNMKLLNLLETGLKRRI